MATQEKRRGFLGGLVLLAAGTTAAVLAGCVAEGDNGGESLGEGASETVARPAGMHHFNTVPARIANVRTGNDQSRVRPLEPVSTKAS
jgi:hypothetical protein